MHKHNAPMVSGGPVAAKCSTPANTTSERHAPMRNKRAYQHTKTYMHAHEGLTKEDAQTCESARHKTAHPPQCNNNIKHSTNAQLPILSRRCA